MKQKFLYAAGVLASVVLCCASGCSSKGQLPRRIARNLAVAAPSVTGQVLYVDPGLPSQSLATLYAAERGLLGWRLVFPPVPVNVGRNGIAPPFEKREGDGRTPSGLFPVSQAFGSQRFQGLIPYRQVDTQDIWVNDVHSPDYNRWVWRGETRAGSFEELLVYRYALVLDYNTAPALRGLGSAIFMHAERAPGATTAGCVTLPEKELVRVMEWLDPEQRPQILVATTQAVASAAAGVEAVLPADLPPGMRARLSGASRLLVSRSGPGGFFAAAVSLPPEVERQMLEKDTWRPGCPVPPSELCYLVTSFWGFDGLHHYGELVVHAALAAFFADSLHHAYNGRFPIERMELVDAFDADDSRSMEANNTSAFNCREFPGSPGVYSEHSYGAAIDVNSLLNPQLLVGDGAKAKLATAAAVTEFCARQDGDCRVLPAASAPFLDRQDRRPGMLRQGDPLLTPFLQHGFSWGGAWRSPEYRHIEYDLRKLLPPQ